MPCMKTPADLASNPLSLEYKLNRADGFRPSEYRREIARTIKHRSWFEGAFLVAKYVDEVDKKDGAEQAVRAVCRTTKLDRASIRRYLSTGRLVIRRVQLAGTHPIPAHCSNTPMPMGAYVEAIKGGKRLGLDPIDLIVVLEKENPLPTVSQIQERTKCLATWRAPHEKPTVDATGLPELYRDDAPTALWQEDVDPDLDWLFMSIDGIYRAARGRSEPAIGAHWSEVTQDGTVIMDGVQMSTSEAFVEMVHNASSDAAGLPMFIAWPEIERVFEHRPEASGFMEILVVSVRLRGEVAGFLMIDFHDPARLVEVRQNSYRLLRRITKPLIARFEREFAALVATKKTTEKATRVA